MANEMKTYRIDVDYEFGVIETYRIVASSPSEARKKAKERFAREYFKKTYLKTYIYQNL